MSYGILVTGLLGAIGAAVGLASLPGPQQAENQALENAETVGIIGGIALLVILFVAYFAAATSRAGWLVSTAPSRDLPCGCGL